MGHDTRKLTDQMVLDHTRAVLGTPLTLPADGYKCTTADLVDFLVGVTAQASSLQACGSDRVGGPQPDTLRGYLNDPLVLAELPARLQEVNAALASQLPALVRTRPVSVAIDLHDRPYSGTLSQEEALRRPAHGAEAGAVTVLSAADPANIFGGEYAAVDTPRFARVPSTHVALAAGQPVLVFEDNGARVSVQPGVPPEVVRRALEAYVNRPQAPSRITVERWNGQAVLGSEGQPVLHAVGFKNTPNGLEWWPGPAT